MMAAGIVSAALLLTPMLGLSQPAVSAQGEDEPARTTADAGPPRVTVKAVEIMAPVTMPDLQALPPVVLARAAPAPQPRPIRAIAEVSPKPEPPHSRLTRLIVGDGRYKVQPFPTVER